MLRDKKKIQESVTLSKNVQFNGGESHFQKSRKNMFINAVTASKSGTFQLVLE